MSSSPGSSGSTSSASYSPNTCQGMMDQMTGMSGTQSSTSKRELKLAQQAQAKGQDASCMSHMRKAMSGMH
ncbi:MAG: hypothetical protein JOZ72_02165 [Alphaproteobacteria bacterium]|nr:hypothetical protein [Alphaproteobacteria bacterium]